MSVPGETSFEVQPGTWGLRVEAPGYLTASRSLDLRTIETAEPIVVLLPASRVEGTFRREKGDTDIEKLTLSYRFLTLPAEEAIESDTIECAITGPRFECLAPAGLVDFKLQAPGRASYYRWGETLIAGKTTSLGPVTLVRGASLVGRVVPDRGVKIGNSPIEIILAPRGFARAGELAERQKLHERRANANAKGYFQFEGLPAGQYEVRATSANLVSQRAEVSVAEMGEAELRGPLVLTTPKRLGVTIVPPLDPSGKPWTVELSSVDFVANVSQVVKIAPADSNGTWAATALVPGEYRLSVSREPRESWFLRSLEVVEDDEIFIDFAVVEVSGEVTRAGVPLEAMLWFGGSIPVRTDADGKYRAALPGVPDDTWDAVKVVADSPSITRTLYDLKMTRTPGSGSECTLDIDLPAQGISGRVTDRKGAVAFAQVFLSGDDLNGSTNQETREDGSYAFDGLEPGVYSVRAMRGDCRSKSVRVELKESNSADVVDLRLDDSGEMTGRLLSGSRGIGAGRVWAIPPDRAATVVVPTETNVDGTFSLSVPAGATHVAIVASAPGFGLSFGDIRLPASSIELQVTADAAILEVEAANFVEQRGRGLLPVVVHRGTFLPLGLAATFSATAQVTEKEGVLKTRISVEPGEYTVCFARRLSGAGETVLQSEKCVSGTAMAGAVLSLRIDAPKTP